MNKNALISVSRIKRGHSDAFAGIDWGSDRLVLIMLRQKELWWKLPGTCWAGTGMPRTYVPGQLILYDHKVGYSSCVKLHAGGRLSQTLLAKYAKQIGEFFRFEDESVMRLVRPDRMLTDGISLQRFHEGKSKK